MKKLLGLLLGLTLALSLCVPAWAAEETVINAATAAEAQEALDSADKNTTIQLVEGVDYGTLYLRPVEGGAPTKLVDWQGNNYRYETYSLFENLTIIGAKGATVDAIEIEGLTTYQGNNSHSQVDIHPTMLSLIELKNVVIDGVTFTGNGGQYGDDHGNAISLAGGNIKVDGLTLKNCVLKDDSKNNRLLYKTEKTTAVHTYTYGGETFTFIPTLKDITVTGCTFDGGYMGLELRETENVTITNNIFNSVGNRNILLATNEGCTYTGNITITGNVCNNAKERFVRMSGAGDAAVTITGNTITNYLGKDADYIKVTDATGTPVIENNPLVAAATIGKVEYTTLQAALDAAKSGDVIQLTPGVKNGIVYIRPTASNETTMYCSTHEYTTTSAKEFKAHLADGAWHTTPHYTTTLDDVTIIGAKGATIDGLTISSGHVVGPAYDYVRELDCVSGSLYYWTLELSNLTFENVNFTGKVDINTSQADSVYDGVTFDSCTFTTGGTAEANGPAIRYYNEANNGNVKNIVVKDCKFSNCRQGVYVHHVNGVTVTDCEFDTTGHNAIGIQGHDGAVNLKNVVITGNTFSNIGDRVIRFNNVGADSDITIQNNTATNSGDDAGEVMKATSIADGVTTSIKNNSWGEGKIVYNEELRDSVAMIGDEGYSSLAKAIAVGGEIKLIADVTLSEKVSFAADTVLDLNGKTLTLATGGNMINSTVTIKNGNIALADVDTQTTGKSNCFISVNVGRKLTLDNVNLTGNGFTTHWAVLCAMSNSTAAGTLNITNSTVTLSNEKGAQGGFIKDQSGVDNYAKINISDSTLTLTDIGRGITGGAVTLDGVNLTISGGEHGINGAELTVKDSTVSISDGIGRAITANKFDISIVNSDLTLSKMGEGEIRMKTANELTIDADSTLNECSIYGDKPGATVNGKAIIGSEDDMSTLVAANGTVVLTNPVDAQIGDEEYKTLTEAIAAAKAKETIVLLRDIALADGITIEAGKVITLDLAGKTISRNTEAAISSAAITNNGNLTIMDSVGGGKITAFAQNPDTADVPYYANNTITNNGVLTVKGGTIENSTSDAARAAFPIDNNSTVRDAIVNIEGGTITGRGAIRVYANGGTTYKSELNITGGTVTGTSYGVWVQNPGSGDPKAVLNISGGTVAKVLTDPSANFDIAITDGFVSEVAIWEADTTNTSRNPANFITGGTFAVEPDDSFIPDHLKAAKTEAGYVITKHIKLTQQPLSVKVGGNGDASVSVAAEGDGLSYQWFISEGNTFVAEDGATKASFSVKMSEKYDGVQVYCMVTDKYGESVQSNTATLTMEHHATITKQPISVTVAPGKTAKVSVDANADGLAFQWFLSENGKFVAVKGATEATFSVEMAAKYDGAKVYCEVYDCYGNSVESETVTLAMEHYATITKQPISVTVAPGKTAKVSVSATGDGLSYKWYFKNAGANSFKYTDTFNTNDYIISAMDDVRDGRQVYCVVTDKYGNSAKSEIVTLSMEHYVTITKQPVSVTVAPSKNAEVTVSAAGDGLSYQWYFSEGNGYAKVGTEASFSVKMAAKYDGAKVYCVVTDKYGKSVKSEVATLAMEHHAAITKQPVSVTVASGDNAIVSLTATGDGLTYKWYFKDADTSKFTYTATYDNETTYSVKMSANRDGRQVYCIVTDKYGNSVKSETVTLAMEHYATITKQPTSVTTAPGKTATITVGATGDGLTYKWYFKDAGASKFSYTTTFAGNTYAISNMDASRDGRQVYCVVTDKYGNSVQTATVTLRMERHAAITKQPVSVTVAPSKNAEVTVSAAGDGLTYKWYFKDAGTSKFTYTATYDNETTYSVKMSANRDGRQVYCVVTDKYGNSVKSETVTLAMEHYVTITKQPVNTSAAPGKTLTVTVGVSGDGLTYKWYFKDAGASKFSYTKTFTGNTYTISSMKASRSGRQIYCVITDKYGNSVQTETITLTMENHATITQQPVSVTVASGKTAKVTVSATGDGLTYKWYYKNAGDSKFTYTSTYDNKTTYTVKMSSSRAGRQIYCVITDKYGNSVTTNVVTLKMK